MESCPPECQSVAVDVGHRPARPSLCCFQAVFQATVLDRAQCTVSVFLFEHMHAAQSMVLRTVVLDRVEDTLMSRIAQL